MKKLVSRKSLLSAVTLIFTLSILFTACGPNDSNTNDSTSGDTTSKLTGAVIVNGSTSVAPLAEELAEEFNKTESDVKIDIQPIGSTQGIKAVYDGTADIGMSSRELKTEEAAWGLKEYRIALDAIAVVVHPSNTIADLTAEQITKIYNGEIKNWKEIGGADKEILVVNREAGSGTRGAFEELMKLEKKNDDGTKSSLIRDDALIADSNGAVKTNIASKDNAIGYISLGIVDETVKALKVGGVEATVANVKAKTYSIWRPFLMLTKGELSPAAKAFLDFIMSDKGQEVVANKFISVKD